MTASWPEAATRPDQKGISFRFHSQQRLRLAAKFCFAARHLAELGENALPEFATRKRQIVGDVCDGNAEVAGKLGIRWPGFKVVQVVALKHFVLHSLAFRFTLPVQTLHCQGKQSAYPFFFKVILRRVSARRRGQFLLSSIDVKGDMNRTAASL